MSGNSQQRRKADRARLRRNMRELGEALDWIDEEAERLPDADVDDALAMIRQPPNVPLNTMVCIDDDEPMTKERERKLLDWVATLPEGTIPPLRPVRLRRSNGFPCDVNISVPPQRRQHVLYPEHKGATPDRVLVDEGPQ